MPGVRCVALCVVVAAGGTLLAGAVQDPAAPGFRTAVRTVPVYATVLDRNGRLVPGLTQADFEILDNGRAVPITLSRMRFRTALDRARDRCMPSASRSTTSTARAG